jgi:predicted permease
METLWQDLRYAARSLAKSPGFALFAIAVIALGIAANTAIFSVVDAVLLRALPYRNPDQLVMLWEDASFVGFPHNTPAPGNYADWKAQNHVFEDVAGMRFSSFSLTGDGDPEQIQGPAVTANLFPILGVKPSLGRVFSEEEDRPGAPHVVILSHGLWLRRFGADPQIIRKDLLLNDEKYTVVGVMPRGFTFPDRDAQLWVPAAFSSRTLANHDSHFLNVVARLKPSVSLKQANADLAAIARRLAEQYPQSNARVGAFAVPLREEVVGDVRRAILVLMGAVAFVLLIACGNVANLVLARSASRRKELAVRMALGATRPRIIRLLLAESVLLSFAAGAAGLLLSMWSAAFLEKLIPEGISPDQAGSFSSAVLGFTMVVSIAAGVLFGTMPALRVSRTDLNTALKQGGSGSGPLSAGRRMRSVLVVSEIALSLVLLTGAALMAESFLKLRGLDPGFRAENVLKLRTSLPRTRYAEAAQRTAFYDQVLARVEALPGVVSAGYTTFLPLTLRGGTQGITIEGQPARLPGQVNQANTRVVSPDYLQTIGVPLISGRYVGRHDRENTLYVAAVNQTMARRYWPGENPLGKRFKVGDYAEAVPWVTVVGVVGDVHQMGLDVPSRTEMYFPYPQHADFSPRDLAIKTSGDPLQFAAAVRQQIWAVDKDQPIAAMMPMQDLLDDEVAPRKLQTTLLGAFAGLALLLASLGVYAVVSYSVTQRTQEIGVRMALGAQGRDVLGIVLATGLRMALIGVGIGLVGAAALSRVIASLLFGVTATDPRAFILVALLLLGVVMLACYIPARRAMRVDPLVALRYE